MGIDGPKVKKILIRGANWLGDSVISIPVIRTVRKNYPDAYIGLVLRKGPAELLAALPYVNKIYLEGKDDRAVIKEKFDLGILLTNSFSSALKFWLWGVKERIGYPAEYRGIFLTKKVPLAGKPRSIHLSEEYFRILEAAGLKEFEKKPEFFIPEKNLLKAGEMLKETGFQNSELLIGVCPGATYGPAKIWPKERYLNVISYLIKEKGAKIIIFGGSGETEIINYLLKNQDFSDSIMASPDNDILTGAALIKKCRLFITNDTGPMHIAAALGIPVIAIFGSTNPVWTGPSGAGTRVIYRKLECSPCYSRSCKNKKANYECLTGISEKEVLSSIEELKIFKREEK